MNRSHPVRHVRPRQDYQLGSAWQKDFPNARVRNMLASRGVVSSDAKTYQCIRAALGAITETLCEQMVCLAEQRGGEKARLSMKEFDYVTDRMGLKFYH